jgi:hypothetical protein
MFFEMNPVDKSTFLNLIDVFVDSKSVVDRLDHASSWLYPLILISAGTFIMSAANLPLLAKVIENSLPAGLPDEQVQRTMESVLKYRKIGVYLAPLILGLKWFCSAGLLFLSCVLLDIRVNFKRLFALVSQCGLITFLQDLTIFLIIRIDRDSIQTIDDLSPRLGLDLIFTGFDKSIMLALSYFSFFTICYIVVLTIMVATSGKCSIAKAFLATIPNWLLPLIFGLVVLLLKGDQSYQ